MILREKKPPESRSKTKEEEEILDGIISKKKYSKFEVILTLYF